ncbi:MAG: GrpB family protein [Kangiellaceae bacterium]|nr:GrpB family protein [Kangiellaceae bacterium]MCW8999146.1 GrpB family protein [Kangiellaceae bacterium]MCW9017619.1 GrpB family protein [Kangiellaceae bacterium]
MEAVGYLVKGENGIPGRRYFQKGGTQRTHHIHTFQTGDSNLIRHRAFKGYLIAHPEIINEYAKLKIDAARKCQNNSQIYMALKNDFIEEHEKLAIAWLKNNCKAGSYS